MEERGAIGFGVAGVARLRAWVDGARERGEDGAAAAAIGEDATTELRRQIDELATAAAATDAELARARALIDASEEGLAETDTRGTVRLANARLAEMLAVHPQFLRDKALIHFVARGDCRAFRGWLDAAARGDGADTAIFHLRPRHGAAIFAAAMRARRSSSDRRTLAWSIRPWLEPAIVGPRGAPERLAALVAATTEAIRGVARGKKLALVESVSTELTIEGPRVARTKAALADAARAALRVADDREPFRVSAHDGSGGEAVVTFGPIVIRVG